MESDHGTEILKSEFIVGCSTWLIKIKYLESLVALKTSIFLGVTNGSTKKAKWF